MAIAVPVFVLVMLALFEGGYFAFALTTVENAAQRGGRLAALPSTTDPAVVQDLVVAEASRAAITIVPADVAISCLPSCTFSAKTSGERVRIVVSYVYRPLIGLVFGNGTTFPLTATTEYNVE